MKNQKLNTLGVLSVDDYVNISRKVWTEIHTRRTVTDYVLHVLDHASKLGEAIRKGEVDLILSEMAETANWLFGFVAKLNDKKTGWESLFNIQINLSKMIWNKYPGICPQCFQRRFLLYGDKESRTEIAQKIKGKCKHCLIDYPKVERRSAEISKKGMKYEELKHSSDIELRRYAQESSMDIPKTLKEMELMFHKIYKSNTALTSLEGIGFHALEEAGELGRALIDIYTNKTDNSTSKNLEEKKYELCEEVAEVFGWLCSLTLKVREQTRSVDSYRNKLVLDVLPPMNRDQLADRVGLEEIIWVKYRNVKTHNYNCPYCNRSICRCRLEFAWENHET